MLISVLLLLLLLLIMLQLPLAPPLLLSLFRLLFLAFSLFFLFSRSSSCQLLVANLLPLRSACLCFSSVILFRLASRLFLLGGNIGTYILLSNLSNGRLDVAEVRLNQGVNVRFDGLVDVRSVDGSFD